MGTANHGYAQQAQEEVRRLFPGAAFRYLAPAEVFVMEFPVASAEAVTTLRDKEPIFLRHIQPVDAELEAHGDAADIEALMNWAQSLPASRFAPGLPVAVHVRKPDGLALPYANADLRAALQETLAQQFGIEPVVRGAALIVSVYVTGDKLYAGVSEPAHNLSDWPGGAIRFQREDEQISRAKFKLLEAEQRFGLDLSDFRAALDIGAAPGGWTSLLLERGLRVTAVDPAALHPSLLGDHKLTYLRKNAGDVRFAPDSFDLLVCDMSWNPKQMARLVADLLYALRTNGLAVITVKLLHGKAFQTVREVTAAFAGSLELLRAKQLFHNRDELTLLLRRV
ncbi:SAM-dependent methyltransferase [Gordoniibacillus kamchatkensis]|uniref:SAM-dependent methyltransferase n=1 Tax=Gordoniibacillus kamchatkensis TaxID=1590651 RepID=A0ABR5AGU3_9BACL|nr:SAM-dependent methyltransferase [Paenibacillus sp. VKM B-2647]KIL40217.1 SAM-dependent methyltransferase [Paenibacillus sp. VKM B-2647]